MLHLVMVNRLRKMVSFELELGKEIEKYVFSSHHKRRAKKKF